MPVRRPGLDASLTALRTRVQGAPDDTAAWRAYADACLRQGEPEAAQRAMEASLATFDGDLRAMARLTTGYGFGPGVGDMRRRLPGIAPPSQSMVATLQRPPRAPVPVASPDETRLAFAGYGQVAVFESPTWHCVARIETGQPEVTVGWIDEGTLAWYHEHMGKHHLTRVTLPAVGALGVVEPEVEVETRTRTRVLGGVVGGRWLVVVRQEAGGPVLGLADLDGVQVARHALPDFDAAHPAVAVAGEGGVLVALPLRTRPRGELRTLLVLLDPATGQGRSDSFDDVVEVVAWSPEAVLLLRAPWEVLDGQGRTRLEARPGPFEDPRWSVDLAAEAAERVTGTCPGGVLLSGDRRARELDLATGEERQTWDLAPDQEAFPLGRRTLLRTHPGGFDLEVREKAATDPRTPRALTWPPRRARAAVHGLSCSPGGEHLAVLHDDGLLCVYDLASGELVHEVPGPPPPPHGGWFASVERGVDFSRDGSRLAVCAGDGLAVIDTTGWARVGHVPLGIDRPVARIPPHSTSLAPDGSEVLVCTPTGDWIRLRAEDGEPLARVEAVQGGARIQDCCYRADGRALAVAATRGAGVIEWDLDDPAQPARRWQLTRGPSERAWKLRPEAGGYYAYDAEVGPVVLDGEGGAVDPEWRALPRDLRNPSRRHTAAFSAWARLVAVTSPDTHGGLEVFCLREARKLAEVQLSWPRAARPHLGFRPDGRALFVSEGDAVRTISLER